MNQPHLDSPFYEMRLTLTSMKSMLFDRIDDENAEPTVAAITSIENTISHIETLGKEPICRAIIKQATIR